MYNQRLRVKPLWPRLLIVLSVWLAHAISAPAAEADPTVKSIFEAWGKRQHRVRTAEFKWVERCTRFAGHMMARDDRSASRPRSGTANAGMHRLVPPKDLSNEITHTLRFDERRMYYATDGPLWSRESEVFSPGQYVSVFDGRESKSYFEASPEIRFPTGSINKTTRNQDVDNYHVRAILMNFRPVDPDMGGTSEEGWRLLDGSAETQDRKCLRIQRINGRQDDIYWIDPERDFIILRMTMQWEGKPAFFMNLGYKQNAEKLWIPASWDTTILVPTTGAVNQTASEKLEHYRLNPKLADQDLAFDFPVGTRVGDRRNQEEYLVLEGNRKRPILDEEMRRNATYEELLASNAGMAGLPLWRRVLRQWGLVLLVLTLLVAGGFAWRRVALRRRAAAAS